MQTHPVVIDGILNGTSPKLRVFALTAAPGNRVLDTYRNKLYALDRKTWQPIQTFGVSGAVDMRAAFDRPMERITISASTPGVVYGDLYIIGSTVRESLPSSPGDIRAYA